MVVSTKDLEISRAIEAEPAGEGKIPIGWRVASGRDLDGDGTPDLAVARHWPTAPATAPRGVVIFSGKDGKKLREILSPGPPAPSDPKKAK